MIYTLFLYSLSFMEHLKFHVANNHESVEHDFLKSLDVNLAGNWSRKYTSIKHLAGTGAELVSFTADKFAEYGLETEVESFDIFFNYPVDHSLKLISMDSGVIYEAGLKEDELEKDPDTVGNDLIPTFHGYSASGNVTAQYIYVNYGTKKDFALLKKHKVSLDGKVAIARYGKIFRGLKVKFAQENGCAGVLIYSDPGDDNYKASDGYKSYPDGPARNPSAVQRGSVQFLSQQPGDPTTPGYASEGNVARVDPHHAIPKIPSLPVSFRDIEPILKKLNGYGIDTSKEFDNDWIGGLSDFKYFTGPNPDYTVNLYNKQSYDIRPIYNVYGKLQGRDPAEGYIIIGNHRDAWSGSASDPNSGSASMLEIIRGMHELTQKGWKPERTIIFASWDGEEYALLGSTEFGEKYSERLKKHCYAYLNMDVSVGGTKFDLKSSPSLFHVLNEALYSVDYPGSKGDETLHDHFFRTSKNKIGILGSGSDFTVFLEHLGIPSVDLGFETGKGDPVYHYHSNFDSYTWMSEIMDPGFKFHQATAKYLGLVALKLANRKVIDLKLAEYGFDLKEHFNALMKRVPEKWLSEKILNKHLCHDRADAQRNVYVQELIFKTNIVLENIIKNTLEFDENTSRLQHEWENSAELSFWKRIILAVIIKSFNIRLLVWERYFIIKEGLTGRPWFKHLVYAAGRDTGYEGFAFPGIKEAIDDNDFKEFVKWLQTVYHVCKKLEEKSDISV